MHIIVKILKLHVMEMGVKKWVNIVCTSKFGPTGVAAGGAKL